MERMDVLVVGAGPAGMALAGACRRVGLTTGLLDPAPQRPWLATYGMWSRELPADLPASVVAARAAGRAIAVTEHDLGWEYAVLDVPALHSHLSDRLTGVDVRVGRAVGSPERGVVALADGSRIRASVVVDAAGRWRPLAATEKRGIPAEQTAYGLVLDEGAVASLVDAGAALFMDWRADHGESGWPTFLYAIPLGGGRVLVEETSLARRPGLPLSTLRRRLHARLERRGVSIPKDVRDEKVSFPVDDLRHDGKGVLGFGAAAPLIHPATGYSLAASFRLAPQVADAIAANLPDPGRALAAAHRTVWSPSAKAIHRFRRIGLEALLSMPPDEVPGFFETFFALPERHRWTYLTARDDVGGTASAMNCLYWASNWGLRRHLVASAVRRPLRSNDVTA
ncbi:lycopene cyclase [Mycolicibacterium gadium]|jgi:lycopene beta-cyclase|uniref:Lycopene cyclase n=3 Tax=Mycobacteriaceae TaxID=1762 RepID=A0A7I7WQM0_MYCGU|nr:lycopene cyclase [Mycobacterium gallinarum]BBZ19969.1 lycopene cyclase [Mycolicibacterium gadium]